MKLENFIINDDFVSISCEGLHIDFHNNYDFRSLKYEVKDRLLLLSWVRSEREWVPKDGPVKVELWFKEVYLFKSKERDQEMPFSEDDCLSDLGFIWDSLVDEVSGFAKNTPETGCTHLNMTFQSGFAIKIGCGMAQCRVQM